LNRNISWPRDDPGRIGNEISCKLPAFANEITGFRQDCGLYFAAPSRQFQSRAQEPTGTLPICGKRATGSGPAMDNIQSLMLRQASL
jgi:hypothetical protein